MPNYIQNVLEFKRAEDYHKVADICGVKRGDNTDSTFDFNRLLPMPEELDIPESSDTELGLYAYCIIHAIEDIPLKPSYINLFRDRYGCEAEELKKICTCRQLELGEQAYNNYERYGSTTWYPWRIKNWGTKWEASDCDFNKETLTIRFNTAWNFPEPIADKLFEEAGRMELVWWWADENTGFNTGKADFNINDNYVEITGFKNKSQEAWEAYIKCWGMSKCIGKDNDGSYYHYDCDDCPNSNEC